MKGDFSDTLAVDDKIGAMTMMVAWLVALQLFDDSKFVYRILLAQQFK